MYLAGVTGKAGPDSKAGSQSAGVPRKGSTGKLLFAVSIGLS